MTEVEQNVGPRMTRVLAMFTLAAVVTFSASCHKKRPKLPPAATAPTITQPEPQPEPTPAPPTTTTTTEPAAPTTEETTTPAPKPKPKPKRHVHKPAPKPQAPPAATQPSSSKPSGQIAAPTNAGNPANSSDTMTISPDLAPGDASSQKRDTERLLQTAETNLRNLSRQLSDGEQAMARQVRNYITQSRLATQDGDLERAHVLAVKAQLLSAELTK